MIWKNAAISWLLAGTLSGANGQTITFTDLANGSGLNAIAGSIDWLFDIAMEDLDADGRLDVFLGNHGEGHHIAFNNGIGTFSDAALSTSVFSEAWSIAAMDYNNDGQIDVTFNMDSFNGPVFRNNGNRQFEPLTADQSHFYNAGNGMAWADWNGDGLPDYMVAGYFGNTLYKNIAGVFTNANAETGIPAENDLAGLYMADLNGDGRPDILLQPTDAASGGGVFADTVKARTRVFFNKGIKGSGAGFNAGISAGLDSLPGAGIALGDIDNDGDLDVLSAGQAPDSRTTFRVRVFRNDGGAFTDITAASGLPLGDASVNQYVAIYYTAVFSDLDNDGFLDVFWAESDHCRLFRATGGGRFSEVTGAGLTIGSGGRPTRVFAGDFDGNGSQDLLVGQSVNSSGGQVNLFRNNYSGGNHWLAIKLTGAKLKTALNSRIFVYAAGHIGNPAYLKGYREVISAYSHRQPLEQHFGLGTATTVDVRAIFFPDSTIVDKLNVGADQFMLIAENGSTGIHEKSTAEARVQRMLLEARPNPFIKKTTFTISGSPSAAGSDTRIDIYDIHGKLVGRLFPDSFSRNASRFTLNWNAAGMHSGMYVARMTCDGKCVGTCMVLKK